MSKLFEDAKTAINNLYLDKDADPRTTRQEINELEEFIMERLVAIEDVVVAFDEAAELKANQAEAADDDSAQESG